MRRQQERRPRGEGAGAGRDGAIAGERIRHHGGALHGVHQNLRSDESSHHPRIRHRVHEVHVHLRSASVRPGHAPEGPGRRHIRNEARGEARGEAGGGGGGD